MSKRKYFEKNLTYTSLSEQEGEVNKSGSISGENYIESVHSKLVAPNGLSEMGKEYVEIEPEKEEEIDGDVMPLLDSGEICVQNMSTCIMGMYRSHNFTLI